MSGSSRDDPCPDGALADSAVPDDERALARLHERLVAAATAEGSLDVGYRTVDSPLGTLLIAATTVGVVRVAFEGEDHDAVLAALASSIGPRILRAGPALDPVARELDEYFAGGRRRFDVALDLRLTRGFRRRVVEALVAIPYGSRSSYGALAAVVGNPRAVRAVGTACATNPVPLLLPCHRVVRADGAPGAYRGGAAAKVRLLEWENRAEQAASAITG